MSIRGSQKLAVLLCRFQDTAQVTSPAIGFFRDLFVTRGSGGLNDYWIEASLGAINLDGTEVFDWRTIEQKVADFKNTHTDRGSKIQAAVDAFGLDRSKYAGVVALFNTSVGDVGAWGAGVCGSPVFNVTFLAHETGHVFGLEHSFDESSRKLIWWSGPGEYYDQWDIMSAMNTYSFTHPTYAQCGPLLCTANLDRMGWLPAERVWNGPDSRSFSECIDLVSLGHPEIPGYLAAHVGQYYVEFRTKDKWDTGIPRPSILIHSMNGSNATVHASDKVNWVDDWVAGQAFGPSKARLEVRGGIRIEVVNIDTTTKKARICITQQVGRNDRDSILFLGSVAVGDGWVLLKDVLYRVPPKGGPLRDIVELADRLASERLVDFHNVESDADLAEQVRIIKRIL